jgi:glycosyltransferase involved in cell wall biosynthesis
VLPFSGHQPVGGFKVVYEYANGLVRKGHQVSIYHSPYRKIDEHSQTRLMRQLLVYAAKACGLSGGFLPGRWFNLDPGVRANWIPSLHHRWLSAADAVVATSWETAEWVNGYPAVMGKKYYLIQHQESTFPGADPERAMATWKMPLRKIVISQWLRDIAEELGEHSAYIPNGLDFSTFDLDIPIEGRDSRRLLMLYHHHDWKGSRDGLAAICRAKQEEPEIKVTLFGMPDRPADLPEWISYEQNPLQNRLRQLYNEAAIFIGPSLAEGWPLPPAEAAQCGAALCLTDIGGHREYGIVGETALFSPPRTPDSLASNILTLVRDNEQRIRLARQMHDFIRQFTWNRAVTSFERCLMENNIE